MIQYGELDGLQAIHEHEISASGEVRIGWAESLPNCVKNGRPIHPCHNKDSGFFLSLRFFLRKGGRTRS